MNRAKQQLNSEASRAGKDTQSEILFSRVLAVVTRRIQVFSLHEELIVTLNCLLGARAGRFNRPSDKSYKGTQVHGIIRKAHKEVLNPSAWFCTRTGLVIRVVVFCGSDFAVGKRYATRLNCHDGTESLQQRISVI